MKAIAIEDQKTRVDAREILFIQKNKPKHIVSSIREALAEKGIKLNRNQISSDISTIKEEYRTVVIEEARRLIKALKGMEYIPDEGVDNLTP